MDINTFLADLDLPENVRRIYLKLFEVKSASARQLAEYLNIPRPSVYDHLKTLITQGLVVEHTHSNKKIFTLEDPQSLLQALQSKINRLTKERKQLVEILPALANAADAFQPKIKTYSGAEGIRQVLNSLLWHRNIETQTMWPISEMVELLGESYLIDLNRERIRRNISIRGIWPRNRAVSLKQYPFLASSKEYLRELRLAPKEMDWKMSYWMFADKVALISSRQEAFGFVIQSVDFQQLLKTQFDTIWKLSSPISPKGKD